MHPIARAALVPAAALAAALCAATSFAGTSFRTTWKSPEAQPGTFKGKKVIAVFMSTDEALRRGVEGTLPREMKSLGIEGVAAYMLVATADLRDEGKAKAMLTESGAAGVVALRLVGPA